MGFLELERTFVKWRWNLENGWNLFGWGFTRLTIIIYSIYRYNSILFKKECWCKKCKFQNSKIPRGCAENEEVWFCPQNELDKLNTIILCTSWQREANVNNSKMSALLRRNWNFGIFSHDLPKKPYKTRTCAVPISIPILERLYK